MKGLTNFWYKRTFFSYLLFPFSVCFALISRLRKFFYQKGIFSVTQFSVPIIVVGNITVGGTGKTPLVIWLANYLKEQGYSPGIVSRGYGGKSKHYPQSVTTQSDVKIVGDEAILLAKNSNCPVVISPNRVEAVRKLLGDESCNIVISDDGLQHYALARSIEIAMVDSERNIGNGFYLPAGPLRESAKRLNTVDFVIYNGVAREFNFAMRFIPEDLYNLGQPNLIFDLSLIKDKKIHVITAIGNPYRFFKQLHQLGFSNIIEHVYPDHYLFKKEDFKFSEHDVIIMTEKDAVKCAAFADSRFWYLPIRVEISERFGKELLKKLRV